MQERQMHRIDIAFVGLQIVAVVKSFHHRALIRWYREKFIIRQERRLARSDVGNNNPARFLAGISAMPNVLFVGAAAGLAGLIDDAAADVVEPAVVQTTQVTVFDAAISQVGAAVRAMQADQTGPALIVTKQDQVLAHDANLHRRAAGRQFFAQRRRLPIPPHHLAAGGTWCGLSQKLVFFSGYHGCYLHAASELSSLAKCPSHRPFDETQDKLRPVSMAGSGKQTEKSHPPLDFGLRRN